MAVDLKPENWTVSSTEALKLSLVDDNGAIQFRPTFTYPIFGDSEQIFGYQNLSICLAFDSVTFKPFINAKYDKMMDDIDDVQEKLLNFLPEEDVVIKDEVRWVDKFQKERESFTLPDDELKIAEYSSDGEQYAVYQTKLSDDPIRKLHKRMQIFTLLFIESASYIDEEDNSWDIFISFKKSTKQCIGYATAYKYWRYINGTQFDASEILAKRAKISQFIIFPPYQSRNHGSHLYNAVVNLWLKTPEITEITIEDPNESFDDLRDRNDLQRLYTAGFFKTIPDELPISKKWLEEKMSEYKLERRQFVRLVEMILLHKKSSNFRLQVKNRLYEKNYEVLANMDDSTIKDKLQTAFQLVKDDYERILQTVKFEKREIVDDFNTNIVKKQKLKTETKL
ncbi:histone acetyltransferase catalytic subunit HAT1 Ecym_7327 [Eremothecium cymbalariae DBVPG|uniref:Histone acetyltransferase type B catalytic subunit n=1 Tax=Eremothecium cymbalariae (strain CBS 270.75 / DBVPG 7215 / KCTC 17166 / NRRL Y-17582) TaxID=931890 RepID=G8JWE6_ERECY|nr:hypothetical protein Ecym_7327 [Eremothecium cymbalariae DBVPG\